MNSINHKDGVKDLTQRDKKLNKSIILQKYFSINYQTT